jgi:hypothetical protein
MVVVEQASFLQGCHQQGLQLGQVALVHRQLEAQAAMPMAVQDRQASTRLRTALTCFCMANMNMIVTTKETKLLS